MTVVVKPVMLTNALYNMHPNSGSAPHYARGVLVGCVSALMAMGASFEEAAKECSQLAPRTVMPDTVPVSWQKEFGYKVNPDDPFALVTREQGVW